MTFPTLTNDNKTHKSKLAKQVQNAVSVSSHHTLK